MLDPILLWGTPTASILLLISIVGVATIVRRLGYGDALAVLVMGTLSGAIFLANSPEAAPSQLVMLGKIACAALAAAILVKVALSRWPEPAKAKEASSAHS